MQAVCYDEEQLRGILIQLKAMPAITDTGNFVDESTETIATLTDGAITIEYSQQSKEQSLPEWLGHVLTFAATPDEATTVLQDMVDAWEKVVTAHPRTVRSALYPVYDAEEQQQQEEELNPKRRRLDANDVIGTRLFIYCSCIQPSLCSDFRGRCIRIVALHPSTQHQIFMPTYYFPLCEQIIETIHIEIKTKNNEFFDFQDSAHATCLVLHFRRIA